MKTNYLYWLIVLLSTSALAQSKSIKIVGGTAPAGTERRLALVVGNKDYRFVRPLKNPLNDATDMTKALQTLGFAVTTVTNADYRALVTALEKFRNQLTDETIALVYYSGHGVSYKGKAYLMPIDAELTCLEQVEANGVSLDRLLFDISSRNVRNSFVFLDACRSLPNLRACNDASRDPMAGAGLVKPTNNPRGSMVVYATEEGSTADDNIEGRNGLFTEALLHYLTRPNWSIRAILDKTDSDVETRSNGKQSPGRYDKLRGEFVFVRKDSGSTPNTDLPFGPQMLYIKGGMFQMGSQTGASDEKPVHSVTVSDFWMGKYEVTVAEFAAFIRATHYQTDAEREGWSHVWPFTDSTLTKKNGVNWLCDPEGKERNRSEYAHPVLHVSYNDAIAYCKWLSDVTGKVYRLPTEAEWEFAAGGGANHNRYSWGNDLPIDGQGENVFDKTADEHFRMPFVYFSSRDGYVFTAPVGQFKPNTLGLHDMGGNVSEWCQDRYQADYYTHSSALNPTGSTSGKTRVVRGGNWLSPACEVTFRGDDTPSGRGGHCGFRVVAQIQ
ncbi:hypothetical protein GCM10023187_52690 [Nibrella viscosa]|uniref:Caspase family p20 domain-containing protein n=1 Tax=Nibrella viscosa TaxID=1084524 RepID=A0ABP8KYV7_9BACT